MSGELPFITEEYLQKKKGFTCELSGIVSLIKDCTNIDPAKRPDFKEICERLDNVILDVAIPDPFSSSELMFPPTRNPKAHSLSVRRWWLETFGKADAEIPLDGEWDTLIESYLKKFGLSDKIPYLIMKSTTPEDQALALKMRCFKEIVCSGEVVKIEEFAKEICWLGPFDVCGKKYLWTAEKLLRYKAFFGHSGKCPTLLKEDNTFFLRFSESNPIGFTIQFRNSYKCPKWRVCGKFVQNEDGSTKFVYFLDNDLSIHSQSVIKLVDVKAKEKGWTPCPGHPYDFLFENAAEDGTWNGYEDEIIK